MIYKSDVVRHKTSSRVEIERMMHPQYDVVGCCYALVCNIPLQSCNNMKRVIESETDENNLCHDDVEESFFFAFAPS